MESAHEVLTSEDDHAALISENDRASATSMMFARTLYGFRRRGHIHHSHNNRRRTNHFAHSGTRPDQIPLGLGTRGRYEELESRAGSAGSSLGTAGAHMRFRY